MRCSRCGSEVDEATIVHREVELTTTKGTTKLTFEKLERMVFGEARSRLIEQYVKKSDPAKWLRQYGGARFGELIDEAVRRWVRESLFKRPDVVLKLLRRTDESVIGWKAKPEILCDRCLGVKK